LQHFFQRWALAVDHGGVALMAGHARPITRSAVKSLSNAMSSTYHRAGAPRGGRIDTPRASRRVFAALLAGVLLCAGPSPLAAWARRAGARRNATAAGSPALVIAGAGDGHGVGMSQEGALGYAQRGYGYGAILAHYYTGTALGTVAPSTTVRVLIHGKVHRMALEAYVRGVVGAEMPAGWPMAALEAQAVASRTYAITDHAGGTRFDVYADTRSQMYLGVRAQTAQTDAAVAATAGQVVTYGGHPAITYFFASSGGETESVQNAFPGSAPEPWLRGVADPFDQGPLHRWSVSIPFATAAGRLRGLVRGSFAGIEVLRRGYSPRIVSAYVLGSRGRTLVSGPELAGRLGLYGTWAYFSVRTAGGLRPEPDLSGYSPPPPGPEPPAPEAPAPSAAGGAGGATVTTTSVGGGTSVAAGSASGAGGGTASR
jgi:SpoIID/LytB domain protein